MRETKEIFRHWCGATAEISAGETRTLPRWICFPLPSKMPVPSLSGLLSWHQFALISTVSFLSSLTLEKAWGFIEKLLDEHWPVLEKACQGLNPNHLLIKWVSQHLTQHRTIWVRLWKVTETEENRKERRKKLGPFLKSGYILKKENVVWHRGSYKQGHKRVRTLTTWVEPEEPKTNEFLEELQLRSLIGFKRHVGPTVKL